MYLFKSSNTHCNEFPLAYKKYNDYLLVYEQRPDAVLRLFCFPYAGGSACIFSPKWSSVLPVSVEYVAIQLPGRNSRIQEQPLKDFNSIVQNVTDSLIDYITGNNPPFAFYGHSLGSLVAFEVCKELQKRHLPLPQHLYFSGRGGPCAPEAFQKRLDVNVSDQEFAEHAIEFFGPQPGLVDQRLFPLSLPPLRADIEAYYNYMDVGGKESEDQVSIPITAWGASGDVLSQSSIVETWGRYTDSSFQKLIIRESDHHFHDKLLFKDTFATCLLRLLVRIREDEVY